MKRLYQSNGQVDNPGLVLAKYERRKLSRKNHLCVTRPPHNTPITMIATKNIPRMMMPVMFAEASWVTGFGVGEMVCTPDEEGEVAVATGAAWAFLKDRFVPTKIANNRRMANEMTNRCGKRTIFIGLQVYHERVWSFGIIGAF